METQQDSLAVCQTPQGVEIHAGVRRLTRHTAVIEVYTPSVVLQLSEVLSDFRIVVSGRTLYVGRGTVRGIVNTGITLVCEVTLEESIGDFRMSLPSVVSGSFGTGFQKFLNEWQASYRISPEYKAVIADLQTFFAELKAWLDQVELAIKASPETSRSQMEREAIDELAPRMVTTIDSMIERFESIVEAMPVDDHPAHAHFLRRQLHPLVLCSPFAYRSFYKPLGYAGDYEVVNMILRESYEGSSLFAKLLNVWLVGQAPAKGHRNRIHVLVERLGQEIVRVLPEKRPAEIFTLGCGPAVELQRLIRETDLADYGRYTLVDFNEETVRSTGALLEELGRTHRRRISINMVKKSVNQILKEAAKSGPRASEPRYDFLYCAGLFDYLADPVCRRLMNIFYSWLAPGGLLLVTNVDATLNASRFFRYSLEFILDWNLIYRSAAQMWTLVPEAADPGDCKVNTDETGVNAFLEVRKPNE